MDIEEEFEELKPILQEKWLDFYSKNKDLLREYFTTSGRGDYYVNQEIILPVLMSIEPKLSEKLRNFLKIINYMRLSKPDVQSL